TISSAVWNDRSTLFLVLVIVKSEMTELLTTFETDVSAPSFRPTDRMKVKHLVFALALINAVLYSCALPLWEGFDEPFHFGYLESISVSHQFPVLHQTTVSARIWRSLELVPLSWLLSQAIPGSISFEQWFHLSREEKLRRERELA